MGPANTNPELTIRRLSWWRRHPWLISFGLFGVTIFSMLIAKIAFDWPAMHAPVPMQIRHAATEHPELLGNAYVYDFFGNFIDSQHLWRVEAGTALIPDIVKAWDVREVGSANDLPEAFWQHSPYWWRPPRTGSARYFVSDGFRTDSRGGDGSFYMMVYDETTELLYVWYKNNF